MYRKESIRTPSGWVPRGRCAPSLTGAWGLGLRICPNSCRVWGGVRLCPPPLPPSVSWCSGQGREAAAAVGRSHWVLPIPPDQMPRQICPGLQTRDPDLHSPAGTLALPRGVVGVVGAGAQQAGKGRAPPSRPRQRPPPTLTGTLLLTCWCRRPLPPPSEAPAEAAAPGSVRTRRGGRWRSGQRDKS